MAVMKDGRHFFVTKFFFLRVLLSSLPKDAKYTVENCLPSLYSNVQFVLDTCEYCLCSHIVSQ